MASQLKDSEEKSNSEVEQQSPKDIALAIFRFRVRRGIGFYYILLATLPLLVIISEKLSTAQYAPSFTILVALLATWLIGRLLGMQKFYRMMSTIDLFEKGKNSEKLSLKLKRILREGLVIPILPIGLILVFEIASLSILALVVFAAWIVIAIYNNVQAYSRRKEDIFRRQVEDWIVVSTLLVVFVLTSVLHLSLLISLTAAAFIWIGAGIKSIYEAPESLHEEDLVKRAPTSKRLDEQSLSELATTGVLSSNARVGILIALQGVERITFTDLLLSMKLSKSSLYKSIGILEEAGYVTMSKGFKATGRPRNFIQITPQGKAAIKEYLDTMQKVTTNYLPRK